VDGQVLRQAEAQELDELVLRQRGRAQGQDGDAVAVADLVDGVGVLGAEQVRQALAGGGGDQGADVAGGLGGLAGGGFGVVRHGLSPWARREPPRPNSRRAAPALTTSHRVRRPRKVSFMDSGGRRPSWRMTVPESK